MLGTTFGKYRIVGQLGRGATGTVYKAVDETLHREVAIKILNPALADGEILKRFCAEATVLARLNHPEIATIHELFRSETDILMVMELVRGETLERLSNRLGPLPPDRAAFLIDRILSALDHAHRADVVHRDLKPANVMVTEAGRIKIMDFGVARVRGAEHMTVDGYVVGTPAYMPPEQVMGQEVDGRADLYSVGVVFYRLLTGTLPFTADTSVGMLQKQIADPPPPLHRRRSDLPEWCDTIVQRALAKSPSDRFQSAGAFRDALGRATGLVTSTDLGNRFAVATSDLLPTSAQPPTPTVVLPRVEALAGAVSAALGGALGSLKMYRGRAAWIHAVLAVTVAMLAYVPLYHAEGLTAAARAAKAIPAKKIPALVLETKALVRVGARQRERDARLVLADGQLTVTATDDTRHRLYSMPYDSVISISYSRGSDPMWNSPKGPARVARVGDGTLRQFGMSVQRHWISLRTNTENRFVILRVDDAQVKRVLSALEERTGRTPQIVGPRRRAT